MQQHTVPRDIGSQEFKLVGSMTLKQFSMLLSGCIVAYIFYLLPIYSFLKWPPMIFSVFFGFAFAFMPIQERAFDHWIVAFIKAILVPSQRVWRQVGLTPEFLTLEVHRSMGPVRPALAHDRTFLTAYLRTLPQTPQTPLDLQESAYLGYLNSTLSKLTSTAPRSAPSDTSLAKMVQGRTPIMLDTNTFASTINVAQEHVIKLPSLGPAVRVIQGVHNVRPRKLHAPSWIGIEQESAAQPKETTSREQPAVFFVPKTTMHVTPVQQPAPVSRRDEKEIKEVPLERKPKGARGRDIDVTQLVSLTPLRPSAPPGIVPAPSLSAPIPQTIAVSAQSTASPPLTSLPNAINGAVKSHSGELLSGVIIVIKDLHGVPLRALKTNRLGQFAIATPLQNGTYTLELEKERFAFDIIQTTITGTVVAPIEIVARSN